MNKFTFEDQKIVHSGRVYYLRTKYERRTSTCTYTIRTQKNGKGSALHHAQCVIIDDRSQLKALWRLYRKFKFNFVIYNPLEKLPEELKK